MNDLQSFYTTFIRGGQLFHIISVSMDRYGIPCLEISMLTPLLSGPFTRLRSLARLLGRKPVHTQTITRLDFSARQAVPALTQLPVRLGQDPRRPKSGFMM